MEKFKNHWDIPEFPICESEEEYRVKCQEYIEAGAIPYKDMRKGAWYRGASRNFSLALWDGVKFLSYRYKFGMYEDTSARHFEEVGFEYTYDVFIPFKEVRINE